MKRLTSIAACIDCWDSYSTKPKTKRSLCTNAAKNCLKLNIITNRTKTKSSNLIVPDLDTTWLYSAKFLKFLLNNFDISTKRQILDKNWIALLCRSSKYNVSIDNSANRTAMPRSEAKLTTARRVVLGNNHITGFISLGRFHGCFFRTFNSLGRWLRSWRLLGNWSCFGNWWSRWALLHVLHLWSKIITGT